jgi:uncharacterized protein YjbJ (UPF0337 family)
LPIKLPKLRESKLRPRSIISSNYTFSVGTIFQLNIHGGGEMNGNTGKGTVDNLAGRPKRPDGEWTGDTQTQIEGRVQQIKGKVEKAWDNVKNADKDIGEEAHSATEMENNEREHRRLEEERKHHEAIGS